MTNNIESIRERLAKATPGEWEVGAASYQVYANGRHIAEMQSMTSCERDRNADFIAHAPSDIAFLLAEVERLTADKARLDWMEKAAFTDERVGNGIVLWPSTIARTGERRFWLQDLGDEDGSNLGEELGGGDGIRAAIDAAMRPK